MSRAAVGSSVALLALALACFAGLAVDPTALIVDGERPSLDHARNEANPSVGNDLTRLFLPHHLAIARSVAGRGRVPAWDDRGFGGRPLVGNPQAGLFYPPTWPAWWSGAPSALGWITVGHLLFSGVGTYRLGRTLGLGGWSCLVAAGCVQSSPYVLAQVFEGHYPHVWAACWYPWAFDAAIRSRRGQHRSSPALAVTLAASFLAGHPQEGYYLLVALGGWAAWGAVAAMVAGSTAGCAPGGGVVGRRPGAGGRPEPPWSGCPTRWPGPGASKGTGCRSGWRAGTISTRSTHSSCWGLVPSAGRPTTSATTIPGRTVTSIGLVPLVLAIIAVAWSADRRAVRGWLVLVVASVLFASGRKLGLFALFYEVVPGMDRFRVAGRALFLASLGGSMLAGMGVDALRARSADHRSWARLARRLAVAGLVIFATVQAGDRLPSPASSGRGEPARRDDGGRPPEDGARTALARSELPQRPGWDGPAARAGWLRPGARTGVAAALGLLGLVELGVHGNALIVTTTASRFLGPDPIGQALQSARPPGLEPPRIRAVDALYDDLRAGAARGSRRRTSTTRSRSSTPPISISASISSSTRRRPDESPGNRSTPGNETGPASPCSTGWGSRCWSATASTPPPHRGPWSPPEPGGPPLMPSLGTRRPCPAPTSFPKPCPSPTVPRSSTHSARSPPARPS